MKLWRSVLIIALLLGQVVTLSVAWAAAAVPPQSVTIASSPQTAPTLEPTPPAVATLDPTAAQDPGQETAAIIIIWAVIILVTAFTIFLIWWTRPGRHPLRGRSEILPK
jgi:ABC-type transport system substrate-binding protein